MNMEELRTVLTNEIMRVRGGYTTPAESNSVSNSVGKLLQTVRVEMEYFKLIGRQPSIPLLGPGKALKSPRSR